MGDSNAPQIPSVVTAPIKNWGRRYIVYPRIQILFLLYTTSIGVLIPIVVLLALKFLSSNSTGIFSFLIISSLFITVLTSIIWSALIFSNRIVGPIYRLQMHMNSTIKNRRIAQEISFRQKDFFSELAQSYSEILKLIEDPKNEKSMLNISEFSTQMEENND